MTSNRAIEAAHPGAQSTAEWSGAERQGRSLAILRYCASKGVAPERTGRGPSRRSEILDSPLHIVWLHALTQQVEEIDDLADGASPLLGVDDPRVGDALFVKRDKIGVAREDDSPFPQGVADVLLVGGVLKSRFGGRGDVDAAAPQAACDGGIDVLIKMKSNHCLLPCQPTSVPAGRGR